MQGKGVEKLHLLHCLYPFIKINKEVMGMGNLEKLNLSSLEKEKNYCGVTLLCSAKEGKTTNGGTFVDMTVSDGETKASVKYWNCSLANFKIEAGNLFIVDITTCEYQGKISLTCNKYYELGDNKDFKVSDFIKGSPIPPTQLYDMILKTCTCGIPEIQGTLIELVYKIYEANKEKLLAWGAAKGIHHNYYGGLLYHTFNMMQLGYHVCSVYPVLNRELLLSAIALHDIGKLAELDTNVLGDSDYTSIGNLFGHAELGIEMINHYASGLNINAEKLMMLKHCVASHHGNLEWGAITKPQIPEADALFLIDMIDSRQEQFKTALEGIEPGACSDRVFGLDTRVYKPLL